MSLVCIFEFQKLNNCVCVDLYKTYMYVPFSLQAFEAGTDGLPDWLLFDDTLATFSGVPMENDAGNTFIEVNMFDNGQLILDEIFSIEVRPAGALMLTRKLSKSFIQKLTNPSLSDENQQQLTTEQTSEQKDFVQPLHFLPSHCPSVSNELIGNILLRYTAQLTPTQWVKLFMLLSDSLGIKVNNLYIRNVLYEDFGRKALVWGHYVGSDSLVDAPSNKTFILMSFLIGCSKDSVYSDIYRVVIQRVNSLLESTDENSLLSVLERWLITLEGDNSTEAQKLHQRHKRQVAVEVPDVQQQDFYVVLTTAVTDAVVASTRIVIPTASVVQSPTVTFSSQPILTTTVIPVVTMLPSSPVFSVEPTTVPFLTISSSFSADQTTMGLTTSFITPSLSVIEPTMSSVFIESSLFITSPSILTFVSSSLIVATSIPELPSTSVVIDETTLPISILLSSLPILSSLATDMITPSVTLEPTDTITSSLFISIETFSVTTTGEDTSVFLTLAPTTPLVLSTSIPLLTSPSIPSETILSSPLFTDVDTTFITVFPTSASSFSPTSIPVLSPTSIPLLTESFVPAETSLSSLLFTDIDATMTTLLTVFPTSAFSFVTTFSSELILSTQSDVIMSSFIFTDINVPTITMVSIDDTTVLPFSSAVLTSVPTIPSIMVTSTPLLDTTLVETLTPVVTLASTTIETIQFTEVPTFSFEDTLTPIVITPSISDVSFFTTASIIPTSPPLTITTPASTSILASPTFDITSAVMLTPSSDVDTFTTEIPNITLSVSETPIFSDTDIIDPTTDMFTSIVLSPVTTSQIPTSKSFVASFSSVFVTVDTPSIVMDTSVSETIAFTTIPSFDISSIIIMPSSDVISVDDTTGTIFTLPVTPTSALTATSIMIDEVIFSTAFSFIDTLSFTAPSVTSVTMNITSAVPSFSPSPDIMSTIIPTTVANISSVFTLPPVSISEDVFTKIQPDFTTSIDIPMTMTSDIMNTSEVATAITSPSTMLPSLTLTPTLIMTTMDEISPTITLMDTDSFTVIISSIPTVIVSSSLPSLTSGPTSEVISPSLTLIDTDSFTVPSMDSSILISPSTMVPSIIPTPGFSPTDEISPTITLMGTDTPSVTMAMDSSVRTAIFSPSTMLPSIIQTSLIVTSPTDEISPTITLMSTDIPSVTIPSIVMNSSIPSAITSPSTVLPSLISSPISEVISPSITLMDTESFTTPSMNISIPTEIISSPTILPTSSLILTSPTDEISPTITLMNTDSFTIVINSSIPTSPSTMLPSLTSSPTRVASPTVTLTDVPSATIPSISSIPPSSLITTTVTPTMFSSIVIVNTSTVDVVSPSSIINETSFIASSMTSILTPSMTLLDSTSIMLSSQVMTPNFTSVIELPSTTMATDITSIVTSITTQVDITSSITVIETSEFVPTTTLVIPTMITPSPTIMSPTTSITTTVVITPTTVITPTPTVTNQPPQLINPIRALTWQEGQPAFYEIPEDTFYDGEDGATSNLSLTLQTLPSQSVSNTSWIQLISGVLYGLPLKEQIQNSSVTEYVFILTAQDSQNVEVHDFLVIVVEPQDPFIANLITFFVEGDFTLFNQQIIEKTTLVNKLISFGLTNATDDVYIRDLFNGSIGLQYGNRTIGNADCTAFAMLIRSIFNNETEMYSNTFTTALLPYNVTKMPLAEGPCITTPPIIITPDLGASVNEERSSTKFIATVIPGVAVLLILLLLALFVCILYRRTHAGRDQITFVRRNTIALEEEVPNRQRRRNPALIEGQCGEVKLTGPDQPDMDLPPAYQRPITYEDYKTVTHCTT